MLCLIFTLLFLHVFFQRCLKGFLQNYCQNIFQEIFLGNSPKIPIEISQKNLLWVSPGIPSNILSNDIRRFFSQRSFQKSLRSFFFQKFRNIFNNFFPKILYEFSCFSSGIYMKNPLETYEEIFLELSKKISSNVASGTPPRIALDFF